MTLSTFTLENYRDDAERCPRCKGCKWVDHIYMDSVRFGIKCPSIARYLFDAYSAYGRLKLTPPLLDKAIDLNPRMVDVIYQCQLCGACDVGCKRNLDLEVLQLLESLRVRCVEQGKGPLPQHKNLLDKVEKSRNRYGAPQESRLKGVDFKPQRKADVLYFPGCAASYTHLEIARATVGILKAANVPFTVLGSQEWCCGHPAYEVGMLDLARKMAEHNLEAFAAAGASTVVTSCAECYKTIKVDYPRLFNKSTSDLGFKVMHTSEFAAQLLAEGRLKLGKSLAIKATYHDSCHLARLSEPWVHWEGKRVKWGTVEPPKEYRRGTGGIYQPPRQLLQAVPGMELVEMTRIRENAWCCGAGGGVREQFKDFALWTAGERLEEMKTTGADVLISACPYCKDNFREAARKRKDGIKVLDLSEVLFSALA